jgi:hypothetical protein
MGERGGVCDSDPGGKTEGKVQDVEFRERVESGGLDSLEGAEGAGLEWEYEGGGGGDGGFCCSSEGMPCVMFVAAEEHSSMWRYLVLAAASFVRCCIDCVFGS